MEDDDRVVTLRPDRGVTTRWSLVGAITVGLALWVALDARDSVLAWAFAALCVVLASYVLVQFARPSRFEVRLDAQGIEAAMPWQRLQVPWDRVHLARVVSVTGEPVLELQVTDAHDPARAAPRATGILLPMGADLDRLHEQLARRLGRADDPAVRAPT